MAFSKRAIRTAALLVALAVAAAAQEPPSHRMTHPDTLDDLPLSMLSPVLDYFAAALKNSPGDRLFFVVYGGRRGCRGRAEWRGRVWKNYLVKKRGVAPNRVSVISGGYRERMTADVLFVPAGADAPPPSPTVDPTEVRFYRSNSRRCRRRA